MPPRLPDADREAILNDIRASAGTLEGSVRKIADRNRVSTATVQRVAKAAGLDDAWSRDKTLHASRARAIDSKSIRTQLALDHLNDAVRIRAERLWAPCTILAATGKLVELDLPPARDVKDFMASVGSALKTSMDVEKHDSGDQGAEDAKSMLLGVAEGLKAMYAATLTEAEPADPEG